MREMIARHVTMLLTTLVSFTTSRVRGRVTLWDTESKSSLFRRSDHHLLVVVVKIGHLCALGVAVVVILKHRAGKSRAFVPSVVVLDIRGTLAPAQERIIISRAVLPVVDRILARTVPESLWSLPKRC